MLTVLRLLPYLVSGLIVDTGQVASNAPRKQTETKASKSVEKTEQSKAVEPTLGGYCPVSYQLESTPVGGKPAFSVPYRNKLYHLASEEARNEFIKDPERFAPRLDGLCLTALGGSYGNRFAGDPTVYTVFEEKLYLFSSERAKRAFEREPKWFVHRAEALFAKPRFDGVCIVSYLTRKNAIQGSPEITYPYKHWTYHFANLTERSQFMKDPRKYIPQYDGHCTEAMSRGLEYPGEPKQFVVYDGKTYLFLNDKAQIEFQTDPRSMIKKADAQWEIVEKRPPPDPGR